MLAERLIALDGYNPEFILNISTARSELKDKHLSGEISYDVYREYLDKLTAAELGVAGSGITHALRYFADIDRNGYVAIDLPEDLFKQVMEARTACNNFFSWADPRRHSFNNAYLQKSLLDQFHAVYAFMEPALGGADPASGLWKALERLRISTLTALARELISRTKLEAISGLLELGLGYRDEYFRKLKMERVELSTNVKRMSSFEQLQTNTSEYDVYAKITDLTVTYTRNLNEFSAKSKEFMAELDNLRTTGVLTEVEFQKNKNKLWDAMYFSQSITRAPVYMPISTFHYCNLMGIGLDDCLLFNVDAITKASIFAKEFYRVFSDKFLFDKLVLPAFDASIRKDFGHDPETRGSLFNKLQHNLEMLRDFHVITLQKYIEYLDKGREYLL